MCSQTHCVAKLDTRTEYVTLVPEVTFVARALASGVVRWLAGGGGAGASIAALSVTAALASVVQHTGAS